MKKFRFLAAVLATGMMVSGGSAMASGDVAKGKKVFRKCAVCHDARKGKNKIGPSLFGIVGSKAGDVKGYRFSSAMKNSNITWTEKNLNKYLRNPRKMVKGTRMMFPGLRSEKDRENLIAYLKTLK